MMAFIWAQVLKPASVYWHLLPLIVVVSLVYSATRHEQWSLIWWRAFRLTFFILVFMAITVAILWGVQML
jgi:hypothetical protein